MTKRKVDPDLLKKLWMEGKKTWEIAQMMRVSICTVQEWRRKLRLPSRREHINERYDLFKKLYLEGKSYREISQIIGVRIPSLITWRKKLQLPVRQKYLSPEEKLQREQQKIEIRNRLFSLVQKRGVVSFDEAVSLLCVNRNLLNEIVREDDVLKKLQLCFGRSPAAKVIPTKVLGSYTAKSIIYNSQNLEAIKSFLIRLIKENIKRPLKRGEALALRYRLERKMHLPKEMVDDILTALSYEFDEIL